MQCFSVTILIGTRKCYTKWIAFMNTNQVSTVNSVLSTFHNRTFQLIDFRNMKKPVDCNRLWNEVEFFYVSIYELTKNLSARANFAPDAGRARSGALRRTRFFEAHILPRQKERAIRSTSFQSNRYKWKSYSDFQILSWTPAYWHFLNKVYISDVVKTPLSTQGWGNI